MNHMGQSVHNSVSGARAPFTTGQWAELEHQALIFKYMMANVSVPQELLNPIRKSVATMNGLAGHHANNCKSIFMHYLISHSVQPATHNAGPATTSRASVPSKHPSPVIQGSHGDNVMQVGLISHDRPQCHQYRCFLNQVLRFVVLEELHQLVSKD